MLVFFGFLYEKKGFDSIFQFAAKLAGVSKEQLCTALNLEKDFEDKPLLKKLLVTGEVSINKLVRIQSVATKENEEFWATQVQLLPSRALETLVRDERKIAEQNKKLAEIENQKKVWCDSIVKSWNGQFITDYKLSKAEILIRQGNKNIKQIASEIGFNSVAYFCHCFKKKFGKPPRSYSDFIQNK